MGRFRDLAAIAAISILSRPQWLWIPVFVAALTLSQASAQTTTTILDGTFNDADWVAQITSADGGTVVAQQVTSGGNPGAYRAIDLTYPGNNIHVTHFSNALTFDPAGIGIAEIEFRMDLRKGPRPAVPGVSMGLRQDGIVYEANAAGFVELSTNWTPHSITWVETDFRDSQTGINNPDFSSSGGEITFGFHNEITSIVGAASTNVDNFEVIVTHRVSNLTTAKDSFLRKGNPNRNEGANPRLRVRASGNNRALIAFNQAEIDDFINALGLNKATLEMTIAENANNWGSEGRTVDAHPLTVDFAEGDGMNAGVPGSDSTRGNGEGVTWKCAVDDEIANQKPDCESLWNGGSFDAATADPVLHVNGLSGAVSWDVTDDVLAGASAWLVKKTEEGPSGKVLYYSREGAEDAADPELAPKLILE